MYNRGRKQVLKHFLALKTIFKTDRFQASHETQARENLRWELNQLT